MVAGVAMGLILEEDGRFAVLTDILGSGAFLPRGAGQPAACKLSCRGCAGTPAAVVCGLRAVGAKRPELRAAGGETLLKHPSQYILHTGPLPRTLDPAAEDALGDMDFKVAGDEDGITAFQMDIKVSGAHAHALPACLPDILPPSPHPLGSWSERTWCPRSLRACRHTRRSLLARVIHPP